MIVFYGSLQGALVGFIVFVMAGDQLTQEQLLIMSLVGVLAGLIWLLCQRTMEAWEGR